jgi:hypothetical protein
MAAYHLKLFRHLATDYAVDFRRDLERYCRGYNRCASPSFVSDLCPRDRSTPGLQCVCQGRNQSRIRVTTGSYRNRRRANADWTKDVTKRPRRIELRTSDTSASRPTSIRSRAGGLPRKLGLSLPPCCGGKARLPTLAPATPRALVF